MFLLKSGIMPERLFVPVDKKYNLNYFA